MSKALIFDFDGTIAVIEHYYSLSIKNLLKEYFSIEMTIEEIEQYPELDEIDKINRILESRKIHARFDVEKVKNAVLDKANELIEIDLKKNRIKPLYGLIDFLEKTRHSHRKAIISYNKEFIITTILRFLNIYEDFDCVITAENSKEQYSNLLEKTYDQLNVPVENCMLITNSPKGISSSKNIGMKCIAIKNKYERSEILEANLIIENFNQLVDVVFNKRTLVI